MRFFLQKGMEMSKKDLANLVVDTVDQQVAYTLGRGWVDKICSILRSGFPTLIFN